MYWWKNNSIQTEQDLRLLLAVDPAGSLHIYWVTRRHLEFLKIQLVLPEVGAVCGVSCCHLWFCIIFRYPDNEISSCFPNVAEVSSLKRDARCTVCWFCVPCTRSLYHLLVLCTICSFFVPYARSLYRMLVFRTVCLFCVPCACTLYRMLGLCTICSFSESYAKHIRKRGLCCLW